MLSGYRRAGVYGYLVVCSTCEIFFSESAHVFLMRNIEDIEAIFTLVFF